LVEVRGYVYAARRGLAYLARHLGKTGLAHDLERQARELQGAAAAAPVSRAR
jgi:hypothetical protein